MAVVTANLLNEDFTAIDDWTDADSAGGVSTVSDGWLSQATTGSSNFSAKITRDIGTLSNQDYTIEIKTKFTALNNLADGSFAVYLETGTERPVFFFSADGAFTPNGSYECGTNEVKVDGTEQVWTLYCDYDAGTTHYAGRMYLNGTPLSGGGGGGVFDYSGTSGLITLVLTGNAASKQSYVDYIKIGTGLGLFGAECTTQAGTNVTHNSFTGNGTITYLGTHAITAKGICYVKGTGTPTISDSTSATTGNTLGAYTVSITGLDYNSTYTARAYATTSDGTLYGGAVTITTLSESSMAVMFF